jgi:hypothetical protein
MLITGVLLYLCARAVAQTTQPDVRTFELTPLAPPIPALKYEFSYDIGADRLAGNGAQLYQDAILLMGPAGNEQSQKALDAYQSQDSQAFQSLADSLDNPGLLQELDLAARRENCIWEPPLHEMGPQTLLPHLAPMAQGLTRWLKVRALRQIELGKTDDAIKTLRIGYSMSEHVGHEPTLVSALVSLRITTQMNDALAVMMGRADAPNLYFALCQFPGRQSSYQHSLYGWRHSLVVASSDLARALQGESLSPEQWRALLDYMAKANEQPNLDPIKDTSPQLLATAQAQFAANHYQKIDEARKIDPAVVLGEFYIRQASIINDDLFKWRSMPYPIALAKTREAVAAMKKMKSDQPSNPFLPMVGMDKVIGQFAKVDRQIAALTAVEAIRSYAAGHEGKLPQHLEDITETPAPADPVTGKPFEYRLENDSAILSATELDVPLTYTIRIRK